MDEILTFKNLKIIATFLVCLPELDKDMMSLNSDFQPSIFNNGLYIMSLKSKMAVTVSK